MFPNHLIDVIIPAFNEEKSIAKVIQDIPSWVRNIVVANNNSTDQTGYVAEQAGAVVVFEGQKGYGKACLTAMDWIRSQEIQPDIVVFLDGDYSDYPEEMTGLIQPIINQQADMVIGSRAQGERESGSMTFPQVFGNWLATTMMKYIQGAKFSDLGPFRAIVWQKLMDINMVDQDYGWTIEMQIKAHKAGLRYTEVPVRYRKRIGVSKVSGTVKGVFGAGYKIIYTIFKYW
ncbi:MAG TPA: UDP-glucose--dolichyl-phosphate glucosyltransferase [Algoriphagus sp.]|jgi:glycosyltransferase involved in cell wall biosynthesis|uniref:glycosyltransferase family 2 protein n=1 Tax=unclassified Algoriphagus TaxID=2641541 RepID=UPI000C36EEA1|nr:MULTISPECIES: glycosyltransferase family 2 protein [unclassified Algoriphagus]MAL13610.1 UDP-glucose--dolichyl-phosphate glucosyltransferase [Algoriphagus sp.]MAN86212.1 UDP-glucose--dolichyl-phosphate glucosyltransferase [Algoriphagus sp.]HAS60760.1 UDP-glucose--dolichyl-phosphate glucosyltransferase [Algoriphagus sp.]HAZ23789.1 UDP-glucose--dolichyl-phosphate glucosyltransferase [Algoriphagus sp.]HCB45895.1 UDP-glucose--dolichyl-phosphate glucosyltransferase [Algoriphagus sp.]